MSKTQLNRRAFIKTGALASSAALGGFALSTCNGVAEENPSQEYNANAPSFVKATPVWEDGRETEMNVTLMFYGAFDLSDAEKLKGAKLRVTGSTVYRIHVDEQFIGYGPARGPHGWFRVDEWALGEKVAPGSHILTIEVAGYASNSYYLIDQPSFLQAELVDGDGKVLLSTQPSDSTLPSSQRLSAYDYTGIRVQKVQRFSFQRPFIEVYDLHAFDELESVELTTQPNVNYLQRRVPYPEFAELKPIGYGKRMKTTKLDKVDGFWADRSLVNIGEQLKGYPQDQLDIILSEEVRSYKSEIVDAPTLELNAIYKEQDAQIFDLGADYCGFFVMELETLEDADIILTFDEILSPEEDVNFLRLGTCSAIKCSFPGKRAFVFTSFEPHCARYVKIHCAKGSFRLRNFYMREYAYPPTREASFTCSDKRLEKLYHAAALTFRANSVDVFMDCPHRERAGWLCDSFFTSRSAFVLTGRTDVEYNFFENYMLPERFEFLPDGMLPMCYPSDHNDGIFIPNWAMWFVVELLEFSHRSIDQTLVEALRTKVYKLLKFFEGYENSDGLLEKLPSWVFVEWSAANSFVQDVNYPSNMLYGAVLEAAGKLYDNSAWLEKAEKVRAKVREQSYDGEFFVDNALRQENGELAIQRNRSEVCQYFAFFFNTATPEDYPELWNKLLNEFGPNRIKEGKYPEVHKANAFVGNVVRLELLARAKRGQQLLDESVAYNEYMADRTGTLWENDEAYASCNHGFASHVSQVLYRDVLGVQLVDVPAKRIVIRLPKIDKLDYAGGVEPVPGGKIKLRWEKTDGKLRYQLETPQGYDVEVVNDSGLELA
ncbi:MAG: alpha-L-rhamnosidase C-terminal domain-containing protein [Planctomycetia bacterium]|nr:alpha-L-rhamnosidase C-terminal domain-containing protein [Planctomycetia bacterium]